MSDDERRLEAVIGEITRDSAGWYCIEVSDDAWVCCIEPKGDNGGGGALARGRTRKDALRDVIRQAQTECCVDPL